MQKKRVLAKQVLRQTQIMRAQMRRLLKHKASQKLEQLLKLLFLNQVLRYQSHKDNKVLLKGQVRVRELEMDQSNRKTKETRIKAIRIRAAEMVAMERVAASLNLARVMGVVAAKAAV